MGGRCFTRTKLNAVGRAVPGVDIEPLCNDLCRRIRYIRLKTQAGTYLLADSQGYVYVLRAQSMVSGQLVKGLHRMVVGLYTDDLIPVFPTPGRIAEDLIRHFRAVGYTRSIPEMA